MSAVCVVWRSQVSAERPGAKWGTPRPLRVLDRGTRLKIIGWEKRWPAARPRGSSFWRKPHNWQRNVQFEHMLYSVSRDILQRMS